MEKMGWSSGKGLGAGENGLVDPIAVRVKADNKGAYPSISEVVLFGCKYVNLS